MNVLSVEYPGYGVYDQAPNAKTILEDAEIVFDFLNCEMKIDSQKIYLLGRSIGSGPATYLAAHRNPGMLLLLSSYTSVKGIAKSRFGLLAQLLVCDRFRNIDEIQKVSCPCFFIHGEKDTLIPSSHTIELFSKCKAISGMSLRKHMTHNEFDMKKDILKPIKNFFAQVGHSYQSSNINFPSYATSAIQIQIDRQSMIEMPIIEEKCLNLRPTFGGKLYSFSFAGDYNSPRLPKTVR